MNRTRFTQSRQGLRTLRRLTLRKGLPDYQTLVESLKIKVSTPQERIAFESVFYNQPLRVNPCLASI